MNQLETRTVPKARSDSASIAPVAAIAANPEPGPLVGEVRGQAGGERNGPFEASSGIFRRRRMDQGIQDQAEPAFLLAGVIARHELAGLGARLPVDDARALPFLVLADRVET